MRRPPAPSAQHPSPQQNGGLACFSAFCTVCAGCWLRHSTCCVEARRGGEPRQQCAGSLQFSGGSGGSAPAAPLIHPAAFPPPHRAPVDELVQVGPGGRHAGWRGCCCLQASEESRRRRWAASGGGDECSSGRLRWRLPGAIGMRTCWITLLPGAVCAKEGERARRVEFGADTPPWLLGCAVDGALDAVSGWAMKSGAAGLALSCSPS